MAKIRRRVKHLPTECGGKKSARNVTKSRAWRTAKCASGTLTKKHADKRKRMLDSMTTCVPVHYIEPPSRLIPDDMTPEQYLISIANKGGHSHA